MTKTVPQTNIVYSTSLNTVKSRILPWALGGSLGEITVQAIMRSAIVRYAADELKVSPCAHRDWNSENEPTRLHTLPESNLIKELVQKYGPNNSPNRTARHEDSHSESTAL